MLGLLEGLVVLQWLHAMPARLPQWLNAPLAVELGLISRTEAQLAAGDQAELASQRQTGRAQAPGSHGAAARAPAALQQLAVAYLHERLYLQRLRLVKLSMLYVAAAGRFEGQALYLPWPHLQWPHLLWSHLLWLHSQWPHSLWPHLLASIRTALLWPRFGARRSDLCRRCSRHGGRWLDTAPYAHARTHARTSTHTSRCPPVAVSTDP